MVWRVLYRNRAPLQYSRSALERPNYSKKHRTIQSSNRMGTQWLVYSSLSSINSGADVQSRGFWWNIDNRTGVNQHWPIGTISPEINIVMRFPFRGLLCFTNFNSLINGAGKSKDLVWNNISKNAGHEKVLKLKNLSPKNRIWFIFTWLTATPINLYQINVTQIT